MSSLYRLFAAFLVTITVVSTSVQAVDAPVHTELLADVSAVVPGQVFRLGVLLHMEADWHVYWQNSGNTGMPTRIQWDFPEGFVVGDLQWPVPEKYMEAGFEGYGYAGETLLFARVETPADLIPGNSVMFRASVEWLACREVCIPGTAALELTLPVARRADSVDVTSTFNHYSKLVPHPISAAINVDHRSYRVGSDICVKLDLQSVVGDFIFDANVPDFFPYGGVGSMGILRRRDVDGTRALLEIEFPKEVIGHSFQGIFLYQLSIGGPRFGEIIEVSVPESGRLDDLSILEMDFAASGPSSATMSLVGYIALALVGGLILNLMPCVLPVISLKVLNIVGQAGSDRRRLRLHSLTFVGGILFCFMILATVVVFLKAGGKEVGWGFQFHYPGFIIALASLVFVLGLSLFGVFFLNFPGFSGRNVGDSTKGLTGSFLNGLLATVLATPCSAPLLGTALGFAFSQSPAIIWTIFLSIGLGMALPYALLALQPRWLGFLPRPGVWLDQFKQGMGFLLMATVIWLMWVLGKQLGVEGVVWTVAFLLCLGLACWIAFCLVDLRSSYRKRYIAWLFAALLVFIAYLILLAPLLQRPLVKSMARVGESEWLPFSVAVVDSLVAADRHVLIDFTAEWCWTCKVNERTVFADSRIRRKLHDMDVALVRADWTHRNIEITRMLHLFGRAGVPLYVILPRGRANEPLILPEVITPGMVLEQLDLAGQFF